MITGADLREQFFLDSRKRNPRSEDEIERIYDKEIIKIYPNTIIQKTFGLRTEKGLGLDYKKMSTDGIIVFDTGDWILQEVKRDIGFNSVGVPRAFLQALCYLARYFDDELTTINVNKFKGILLDSARYVCFISRKEIIPLMDKFIPIYKKYYGVRPCDAYFIPEMNEFSLNYFPNLEKFQFDLDETFRFDSFIIDIYNNNF